MSDRMNIGARLEQEFGQLKDTKVIGSMKSLRPNDKVALLARTMQRGGLGNKPIRHVPIIAPKNENQPKTGELQALISKLDVATLLSPPWDVIPKEVIDSGTIDVGILTEDLKYTLRQTIQEAFKELFSGKTPELSYKDTLEKLMNLLTSTYEISAKEGGKKNRRYKTIPIFNEQHSLIGMLSYIDVLRQIQKREEAHSSFLKKPVRTLLKEIDQEKDKIKTIESDSSIFEAISLFQGVSFTHLPVVSKEKEEVIGIIDDVLVNTYEHPALLNAFAEVPLSEIATPINLSKNIVSSNVSLAEVIGKLLSSDRPTAILVGEVKSEKVQMDGIISYLDVLKNFKSTFLSATNSIARNEPPLS